MAEQWRAGRQGKRNRMDRQNRREWSKTFVERSSRSDPNDRKEDRMAGGRRTADTEKALANDAKVHLAPSDGPKPKLVASSSFSLTTPAACAVATVKSSEPLPSQKKRKSLAALFNPKEVSRREREMRIKTMHVVVLGPKKVGKTALLRTLVNQHDSRPSTSSAEDDNYVPTLEDTFHVQVGSTRPDQREIILFHDTAGLSDFGNIELRKPYLQVADGFLLVYSVMDMPSFNRVDALKKYLDREKVGGGKERKEVPIVVVGTNTDKPRRNVDQEFAVQWANREKVKLFETSLHDRDSLVEVVHHLAGKHFHSLKEPKFSLSRKLKPEKSNAQIVMDF